MLQTVVQFTLVTDDWYNFFLLAPLDSTPVTQYLEQKGTKTLKTVTMFKIETTSQSQTDEGLNLNCLESFKNLKNL